MNDFAGIGQICYVTRNLDETIRQWLETYRAGPFYVGEFQVPGQHCRGTPITTHLRVGVSFCGPVNIELVEPLGPGPTIFHEVLEKQGEVLHHFWKQCDDYDREMAHYASLGYPVVAGGHWPGIGRTSFVDTRPLLGVFTEVLESGELLHATLAKMRTAHLEWDGMRPIRSYEELGA